MSSRYGLSIQTANRGDADGLGELLKGAGVTVEPDRLSARLVAALDQPGVILVADEWGPPSGLIALHWHAVLTADLKAAWISVFFVDPDLRRNGIGRLLLKAASQSARSAGCGELVLNAAADSHGLTEFCLATGFIDAGRNFTRPLRRRG